MAEKLPPDATLVDAIYELEFRQAVEEGLASLDRGERSGLYGPASLQKGRPPCKRGARIETGDYPSLCD